MIIQNVQKTKIGFYFNNDILSDAIIVFSYSYILVEWNNSMKVKSQKQNTKCQNEINN